MYGTRRTSQKLYLYDPSGSRRLVPAAPLELVVPDLPTYRYYRFTDVNDSGGNYLDFNEVAFWHDGARVSGGTYSTSGGFVSLGGGISTLGDGNVTTRVGFWDQSSYRSIPGFYIQVDFGTPKTVSSWRQSVSQGTGRGFGSCTISGSNSTSGFTFIQSYTGITTSAIDTLSDHYAIGGTPVVNFPNPAIEGMLAVYDGTFYVCTAGGSPGTWDEVALV